MKPNRNIKEVNVPGPFFYNAKRLNAIILGADPSNFSDKGKRTILTKAFGIGDGDARYFQGILANLKEIGLNLEDIYVDNLIQKYLNSETSKNIDWTRLAKQNITECLGRLDKIDERRRLPVFITAEAIFAVISSSNKKAVYYYTNPDSIPVSPADNELRRPIIPLYRHLKYSLQNPARNNYRFKIIELLKKG